VIDASESPMPEYGWGLPGQRGTGNGVTLNGWRAYVPEIGRYTTPDPDHAQEAFLFPGPQAYTYVASRPLVATDPEGRNQCSDDRPTREECRSLTDMLGGCEWARERLAECDSRTGVPSPEYCDCYRWYVQRFCEPYLCCSVGTDQ
ncbi:MAG: hypothetical protein IT383_00240, partial [Deltaproteobacteria bacterium]|nr:hypothetical protein [Deltaproteobacteria bacterium]